MYLLCIVSAITKKNNKNVRNIFATLKKKIFPFLEEMETSVLGLVRSFCHFCDSAYDDVETVFTTIFTIETPVYDSAY